MMVTEAEILRAGILIVDDQLVNVQLLEQLLSNGGYKSVTSTMDPLQACELHRKNQYDLILLDLKMPGMDGFQVMEALQAHEAARYLPVIVLTAEPGHKLRALQCGARDFISKPFDLVEARTRIRNMLEVRLLYKQLENYNQALEQAVAVRTAELGESEARFRGLTKLASDWYWEQNDTGEFTTVSGPVMEMLGLRVAAFLGERGEGDGGGWDEKEQGLLQAKIATRQSFQNFAFNRTGDDGSRHRFQVSGEPVFDASGRFTGYRGVGVRTTERGK